jgi:hypothetical protein
MNSLKVVFICVVNIIASYCIDHHSGRLVGVKEIQPSIRLLELEDCAVGLCHNERSTVFTVNCDVIFFGNPFQAQDVCNALGVIPDGTISR